MTLDEAVVLFATTVGSKYADPEEAHDACAEAAGEFIHFLIDLGVVTPPEDEEEGAAEHPCYGIVTLEFQPHSLDYNGKFYGYPLADEAHMCLRWHAINCVEGRWFDWTARQIEPTSPFPLTWTDPCTSSLSMPPIRTATTTTSTSPSCPPPT